MDAESVWGASEKTKLSRLCSEFNANFRSCSPQPC